VTSLEGFPEEFSDADRVLAANDKFHELLMTNMDNMGHILKDRERLTQDELVMLCKSWFFFGVAYGSRSSDIL
jgi:hypothetical protein